MKKTSFAISTDLLTDVIRAVTTIAALTAVMMLIGRPMLGEAVIAMLYLLAIAWLTSQIGQLPGLSAALTAALMFDFFFIPPFLTFDVESVEGWLMLVIFVLVAVILVNRIQAGLAHVRAREQEALHLFELSMTLVGLHSREEVAGALAEWLQRLYQAAQVQVTFFGDEPEAAVSANMPARAAETRRPDRVIPIQTVRRLVGEISLWHRPVTEPAASDRLLERLPAQLTQALERMRLA
jgi:two-component system, OmpR family, sensor histidine kinase KdpD